MSYNNPHDGPDLQNGSAGPHQSAHANGRFATGPTDNLEVALEFVEAGIPVFPAELYFCSKTGKCQKKPRVTDWPNTATTDAAQVEDWWKRFPNAAPGLALGRIGVVAIDADRHGGPDGVAAFQNFVAEHGGLPGHPITHTPGHGEHHFFKQPPGEELGNGTGMLPDGIDVRGHGGWVVAPGTIRPDGKLWLPDPKGPSLIDAIRNSPIPILPDWLRTLIIAQRSHCPNAGSRSDKRHRAPHGTDQDAGTRERTYARIALEGCVRELAAMQPDSGRNNTLNAVAYRLGRMVVRGWIEKAVVEQALWQACDQNGLIAEDGPNAVRASLGSGLKAGLENPHEDLDERTSATSRTQASKSAGAVEDPLPLTRAVPLADPYPVDALGLTLSTAARAVQAMTQAPIDLCANAVLAVAALATQTHADIVLPSGEVKPLSLYLLTIAASGERKSATDSYALSSIKAQEAELRRTHADEMVTYQNAHDAWAAQRQGILKQHNGSAVECKAALDLLGPEPQPPLTPILTFNDLTIDGVVKLLMSGQPSIGLFAAEGGTVIGGHAFAKDAKLRTASMLSDLWDTGRLTRIRSGDGASAITGRRLSMHIMVQPDVAAMLLGDPLFKEQGLLSRILIAAPESAQGTRMWSEPAPQHKKALQAFESMINDLYQRSMPLRDGMRNELDPPQIRLTPDAHNLWVKVHNEVERRLGPGGDLEPIKGFAAKLPEHATRIAGVIAKMEYPDACEISADTLAGGITLARHYAGTASRLHGVAQINADLRDAQSLLDWIKQRLAS